MRTTFAFLLALALAAAGSAQSGSSKTLDMYFIDTEGGHATLYVSPSGESLLMDTGSPGGRDADRIMAVIQAAGVKQIDHLILTHYHSDHVGGLQELATRIPILHFIDHGPTSEPKEQVPGFQKMYAEMNSKVKHTVAKPGDKIPFAGVTVAVVTSNGEVLKTPLPGGGKPNPACAGFAPRDESRVDPDNPMSVGVVFTYGKFRTVNLGDFTWNKEQELMCPNNPIGTVDLYLTSHHGIDQSGSAALVHGLHPRVAVMHNSTRKGGAIQTMQILHTSPGLEDIWQLHWAYAAGLEQNSPGLFIANVEDNATVADVLLNPRPTFGQGRGPGGPGAGTAAAGGRGRRTEHCWTRRPDRRRRRPGRSHGPGILDQGVRGDGRNVHRDQYPQQLHQDLRGTEIGDSDIQTNFTDFGVEWDQEVPFPP
ncbi:Beta-lactamase domain protein (modular protein) [Candidatus Sulfopaludibacter sp. SbA4]|nr:Beta-lactamase domain protein (modular protein) [Candidatus Sulfopaludibacter sp. SbA4]